ncbi:flavin reductase family protein, partial [Myxococcota bacterium]|nr:flavin reductase family protein [Myxococcota bacterium]
MTTEPHQKTAVEPLSNAYRLLNPGVVVLVSVGDDKADNLFSVAWNMPLKRDPALVALLIGKRHYSWPFIEKTGEFGVNIPDATIMNAVLGAGRIHGSEVEDKFAHVGLHRQEASKIKAPLVLEAVANMECKVSKIVDMDSSVLVIGEVLEAVVAAQHFDKNHWVFENGLQLIHHLGGG